MKRLHLLTPRRLTSLAIVAVGAMFVGAVAVTIAKDGGTTPARKKLTGAELYAINCNRCHAERYATERTAAQWKSIMLHMRVRANLPANQAKAILKYLQEDCGN
jgi:mono/diheme cytochrome c family protein